MTWPDDALTATWLEQYKRDYLTIDCGAWSYGRPRIRAERSDQPRKLTIGRYCSIADGVKIFVGRHGRHPMDTPSPHPIGMAVTPSIRASDRARPSDPVGFAPTVSAIADNLDVFIGHDVWIGLQAIIFAGVTVGIGSVVGARAVVSKDVPPYAIV